MRIKILRGQLLMIATALLLSTSAKAQTDKYAYPTKLKSGYQLEFKTDDSLQYLFLKKGNSVISEISSCSKGLLHKNLGYVGTDFNNSFVLVQSFGAGNPHPIQLIDKSTGKNSLPSTATWIDAAEEQQLLLYHDETNEGKMTLLDVSTGKKKTFTIPADHKGPLNELEIEKVTGKQLLVKYHTAEGTKTATFNR